MPLTYRPGDLAEVDFFEVLVDVDGTRRKAWLFLMRLMYSGRDFALDLRAPGSDQLSRRARPRLRALRRRAARVAYDNLRAAVVRILVGGERTLTPRFAALASHYLLEPCFCRPGEGHDKGGVEARGKAVRQQALVPIPSGADARRRSMRRCSRRWMRGSTPGRDAAGQTIGVRFAEEQRRVSDAARCRSRRRRRRSRRCRRARWCGSRARATRCRVAGPASIWSCASGATTVTIVGRDGTPHRASAEALRAAVDRLPALPAGARAQAAGGAPGAARSAARSRRAVSGDLGSASRGAWAARGRAALCEGPRAARDARAPTSSCPR